MLVAVDNHAYLEELMEDILSNPKMLDGMHVNTLAQLASYAVEKDDFRVLTLITELYTGVPSTNDYLPEWWLSDFYDDITKIKFEHQSEIKEIRWCDVTLDDGERLTSKKHQPLLNAFKYWVTACDNPLENGGQLISSIYANRKYNNIIKLINTVLINGTALKLSEFHLQKVNDAFWLGVLVSISEYSDSITNELYQVNHHIKTLLDNVDVSQDDVDAFTAKYPHVLRHVASDEITLNLKDRVKACCWLHQQRYYAISTRDKFGHRSPKGNNAFFIENFFKEKILSEKILISTFPELELKSTAIHTEYKSVPNLEQGSGSTKNSLSQWVKAIKFINTNIDKGNICWFNPVTSDVSIDSIERIATLRKKERTKTLPPDFVFDLFRESYEMLKQLCSSPNEEGVNFWDNMLELLNEERHKSRKDNSNPHRPHSKVKAFDEDLHRHLPQSELSHWVQFEAMDLVHNDLKVKGVQQFESISSSYENRHKRIRNNESMLDLFTVLQGALQLLLGSIMARRQGELLQLKPFGNLVFINEDGKASMNVNPFNDNSERWSLQFKVKKTGVKGKNLTENRPIPLSIARFVWQLEQFNQQAIELGLVKESDLALFNYIDINSFKLNRRNSDRFNDAFDALCDYFETTIIEMENGEYRRHYVRQHQLRRFFALVFFWSRDYENLEALRWMLAHSDLEHLHNYITENVDGAVINSAKASVITQSITRKKSMVSNSEELEKLRKVIAKRYSGDSKQRLSISTLDDAAFDYEDESEYETVPHISRILAEQELENEVLTLLEDGTVILYPEWIEITDEGGEVVKNFNLILKVNELKE
ncbi:integrase [Vibrio sp. 10N.286.48.B7]|uniref:integrase n=1 Tax=Vibrio sp. 10N.286.48.B7 TaxID=1880853 RepID=UPI000C83F310|nr:integrase [Vibrio sp. 10N.286.48.B7]PMH83759.1 integrase [Vibrio sp. 10N.286.48.B7]